MFGPHATKQYGSLVTSATDKERKHTCLRKVRLRCKQKASTVCSDVIFTLHGSHVLVIAMDEAYVTLASILFPVLQREVN